MKFTLFYEIQLPTPWAEGDQSRMYRETLEHVELADRSGAIHGIWATEHHFLEDHSISSAPEVWLGAAAARTKNIRIGHGIVCMPPAMKHPARIAENVSTLDLVSDGRVEFGTGESSSRMELEGFGVDRATKHEVYLEAVREVVKMMTLSPYPGYDGAHFSMPCRNVIPKPQQRPHPPLWVAAKANLAARHGMGCLGFGISGLEAARAEVQHYYDTFARECTPIGRSVNPNVAVVSMTYCHPDGEVARERAVNLNFFGYSLAKYYLTGSVRPGREQSWPDFQEHRDLFPNPAEQGATVGTPAEVRAVLTQLEAAGVDQVILLHQGGHMEHEWTCESLELLARDVLPEFVDRDEESELRRQRRLEPAIERAMARAEAIVQMDDDDIPLVDAYATGGVARGGTVPDEPSAPSTSQDTVDALGLGGQQST